MVGTSVSHYRVVDKLGSGGMGEVYLAEDEHLRRRVAIKLPDTRHDSPGSRRRFEHEAQVASRLTHPNIARIYDYGEAPDGRPFLVMELVDGKSLRDVLLQGRLQPGRAAVVVAGVLRALEAAHRNGLVHRDIKPANVMLDSSDEVKVLDFGLAKEAPEPAPLPLPEDASLVETVTLSVTLPGMMAGTPAYMPPEQARALRVDARADLFSTGLVLYECLTGIAVFSGRTQREVLDKVCTEDPVPASVRVPELSKAWDRVLARALCKDPAGRYQSAAEMLEDVEALGAPQPGSWTGSVAMALAGTRRRAAVSVIGAMVVLIVALLLTRGMGPHRPSAEAAGWYQRGAMALRDGTYYSAARVLQKAVDLDPDYGLAHARLADAVNELEDGARASAEMLLALAKTKPPGGTAGLYIDAINRTLTGDFTGAAKTYRQLADKAQGSEKAAALVDLARVYDKSQQPAKAIEACRESLANDPQSAAAHLRLGVLLGRAKSPECAQEFDRAFALYQALSNTEGQAEVLYQRGFVLTATDPARAQGSLEKARDMARAIGSEQQEIAATLQLGTVAYLSGDLDTAGRAVNEGVERARRAGMNYLAARGTVDVGNVYFLESDFARAEASFRESLEIARRYHLRRAEARALFSLGNVQQRAGRQEQALQDVAPALTYFREGGFQVEAALCLMVIARAYRDLGNGRQAADNFERALTTAQRASDPGSALIAEQGLASVLLTYGHWPEAAERYQSARQSAAAIGDANGVVRGLTGQAAALVRLGRLTEAENALTEADRAVEKAPARANLATNILHRRAELLLSRGRNSEAAALARRAFEDKAVSRQTGHPLRCIAGVALARAGRPAAGRDLCEPAVAALVPMGDRFTTLEARLQLAEILLALRQDAAALDAVANVIGETAALDDRETGWRAWALRARALRQQGDREGARQAEQKASELMASLGWDAAVLQGYGKRADIAAWRAELSSSAAQVRTASK